MQLEIAVQDPEGIRTAHGSGADRIELCQALVTGGLTPSLGLMKQARDSGVEFRALIRPRSGGYRYTAAELATAADDVSAAVDAGASGVIIGALTEDGLDQAALTALAAAARGRTVIVHRCVDVLLGSGAVTPADLVSQLRDLGMDGVLTSGGAPRAVDGIPVISELAAAAEGQLEIVAGGGLRAAQIPAFEGLGIHAIHMSASIAVDAGPPGPGGGDHQIRVTDPEQVAAAKAALLQA